MEYISHSLVNVEEVMDLLQPSHVDAGIEHSKKKKVDIKVLCIDVDNDSKEFNLSSKRKPIHPKLNSASSLQNDVNGSDDSNTAKLREKQNCIPQMFALGLG
jgi:hypothetical protein